MADKGNGKTRGNGPVKIVFVDGEGKPHKRIADGVSKISVTDTRTNKHKQFDVDALSSEMLFQLAVGLVGHRMLTNIRNAAKVNPNADVLSIAESIFENLKKGHVYTRGEGNGKSAQERHFDYEFWKEVFATACAAKGRKANEKQLESFEADLRARSPKDRWSEILKAQRDPHIKMAAKKIRLQRQSTAIKKGEVDTSFDGLASFGL